MPCNSSQLLGSLFQHGLAVSFPTWPDCQFSNMAWLSVFQHGLAVSFPTWPDCQFSWHGTALICWAALLAMLPLDWNSDFRLGLPAALWPNSLLGVAARSGTARLLVAYSVSRSLCPSPPRGGFRPWRCCASWPRLWCHASPPAWPRPCRAVGLVVEFLKGPRLRGRASGRASSVHWLWADCGKPSCSSQSSPSCRAFGRAAGAFC